MTLDEAFIAAPRIHFIPRDMRHYAQDDRPLPIGHLQTISQPSTVRMMLEWLHPQPGDHVLDVGSGSGWTTALLSSLVGSEGDVIAVERVPELVEFGQKNCRSLHLSNVQFYQAGSTFGWPDAGPYDRILVSASADHIPEGLIRQLKPGGTLVLPVGFSIFVITKSQNGEVTRTEHAGYVFVPLLGDDRPDEPWS